MPESTANFSKTPPYYPTSGPYEFYRNSWFQAGVDQFTQPPSQNPDSFTELTNILPPITNTLKRRFGYATFIPKLDTGLSENSDQVSLTALYGASFDGESGYVSTANSISLSQNPTISIEFWFETSTTAGGYFVSHNASSTALASSDTQYLGVFMKADGTIGAGFANNTVPDISLTSDTSASYNDGLGHYVVVTFTGGTGKIYVDGVLQVTTTGMTTNSGTNAGFWRFADGGNAGTTWPSSLGFNQTFLSHVAIYPVALSQAQVTAHFTALTGTNGTQSNYESTVKADLPSNFWPLTESSTAVPPTQSTIVQETSNFSNNIKTCAATFSSTVTKGNLIFAFGTDNNNGTGIGIADTQGNSYTQAFINQGYYLYYAYAASSGSLTVTFTGTNNTDRTIMVLEMFNVVASTPVDGTINYAQGNNSNFNSPTIATAAEPDVVLSPMFGNGTWAPTGNQGFALAGVQNFQFQNKSVASTIAIAFTSANTTGNFFCPWSSSTGGGFWTATTVALKLKTSATNPGTTAYDIVGGDNGTYTVFTNFSAYSRTSLTTSSTQYVSTSNPATAVASGTLMVALISLSNTSSAPSVTTVTDSLGNSWNALSESTSFVTGSNHVLCQLWYAPLIAGIVGGSSYVVTINCTTSSLNVIALGTLPGASQIDQQASNSGSGASGSTGSITTTATEFLLAMIAATNTITTSPSAPFPPTFVIGNSGASNAQVFPASAAAGTYDATFTDTSGTSWCGSITSLKLAGGFFLGQYIVLP